MGDEPTDPNGDTTAADTGFSTAEKALGAWAAYEHPLVSGLVTGELSRSETDPARRRQFALLSRAALAWWAGGLVTAVVTAIVVIVIVAQHGAGGGCKGGPDKTDPMSTTYQSTDGTHWTATYPCVDGGSTTVLVPARDVPGGGR